MTMMKMVKEVGAVDLEEVRLLSVYACRAWYVCASMDMVEGLV